MAEKTFLKTLGERIAILRKQKGFSQEEFAEKSGKMINTISNIERGLSDPKITTLFAFSKALNISIQDLLRDMPPSNISHSDTLQNIIDLLEGQDEKTLKISFKQILASLWEQNV